MNVHDVEAQLCRHGHTWGSWLLGGGKKQVAEITFAKVDLEVTLDYDSLSAAQSLLLTYKSLD